MKDIRIGGIIPPIVTPMHEDETINFDALEKHIERLLQAGVHGIFAFGTNGECYALSPKEKGEIISKTVRAVNGRVPVYAGTGCITTKETTEITKMCEAEGADVLSIITPSFAAASQDELYDHYTEVAAATKLPIVLYNIPARTGNALAPATVARLAKDVPNIVGVKDSSGNFDNTKQYIERTTDAGLDFSVLMGNDSLILPGLMFGVKGGVAGCANVFPKTMVGIYEEWKKGNFEEAKRLQDSIRPFRNCFKYGNANTIVKIATGLLGNDVGPCRKPFCCLSEEGMNELKKVLESCRQQGME